MPVHVETPQPTIATLTVNGHRVADLRAKSALRRHAWVISAVDGLRVGRNVFEVKAYDKSGARSVKRWTVVRSAQRPLANAGAQERVTRGGGPIRLDASGSRATRKGAKLAFAWRVVKAPKGAKPVLRNATSAKPTFKPDKLGIYQLALRATQSVRGRASAADASSSGEDVVTVDSAPPLPGQGLWVDTGLYNSNPSIKSASPYDTIYVAGTGVTYANNGPDDFIQLDASTLTPVAQGTYSSVKPTDNTVTIGAWEGHTEPFSAGTNGSVIWIGTKMVALNDSLNGDGSNGNPNSNLHGWLVSGASSSTGSAAWTDADMIQAQTRAAGDSKTTNTMVVNGTSYPASVASGQGGAEVLFLDNTGTPINGSKLFTFDGDASDDAITEQQLSNYLSSRPADVTTMLQAFGTVPAWPGNGALANEIQNDLGARADVVDRFNGADGTGGVYSMISGAYTDPTTGKATTMVKEASAERVGSAVLNTLLVRDSAQNDYIPMTTDSATPDAPGTAMDSSRNGLLPLIYSAPSSWANWMPDGNGGLRAPTDDEQAQFNTILQTGIDDGWYTNVAADYTCQGAPDALRGYLCNSDANALGSLAQKISGLQAASSLTHAQEQDFDNVRTALVAEVTDATDIRSTMQQFSGVYGVTGTAGIVNAAAIGQTVTKLVKSETAPTSVNELSMLSALSDMASIVPGLGPGLTFMSGAFGLVGDELPDDSGAGDVLGDIQTTQTNAAATLITDYQKAGAQFALYADWLAADPMKLLKGGEMVDTRFAFSGSSMNQSTNLAEYAAQEWLWGTILSAAYTEYYGPQGLLMNPGCQLVPGGQSSPSDGYPFGNMDFSRIWPSSIGVGSANTVAYWWPGLKAKNSIYNDSISLPKSITDTLFGTIDANVQPTAMTDPNNKNAGPVGAVAPYFWLDYLGVTPLPVAWGTPTVPNGYNSTTGCFVGTNQPN